MFRNMNILLLNQENLLTSCESAVVSGEFPFHACFAIIANPDLKLIIRKVIRTLKNSMIGRYVSISTKYFSALDNRLFH